MKLGIKEVGLTKRDLQAVIDMPFLGSYCQYCKTWKRSKGNFTRIKDEHYQKHYHPFGYICKVCLPRWKKRKAKLIKEGKIKLKVSTKEGETQATTNIVRRKRKRVKRRAKKKT